ncbi:MAG: DNA-directed RNA polymerase subunit beta' [Candidatus Cloacimonadota bacterium]|nr:MAG: DNA-directed RNA polymerase subunit beta' [Candidatus Cloacimonadota bacterium]PIE78177.1 MAG: DNA-directed RNA polymerase subunit beta' [Candidatus Delongbacteria bacterium]
MQIHRFRQRDVLHKTYSKFTIKLMSPDKILKLSRGEVTKPETVNYRTYKPEKDGLFCEKIFGPTKDWECSCGKYKGIRYKGIVCDKCGVEINKRSVRRERIGHIKLAVPVVHIWFFRALPSKIGNLLEYTVKTLEEIIYYEKYAVIQNGFVIDNYQRIIENHNKDLLQKYHSYMGDIEKVINHSIKNGSQLAEALELTNDFLVNFESEGNEELFNQLKERVRELDEFIDGIVNDKNRERKPREKEIRARVLSKLHDEEDFLEPLINLVDVDKDLLKLSESEKFGLAQFNDLVKDLIDKDIVNLVKDLKFKSLITETDYNTIIDKVEKHEDDLPEEDWFIAEIGAKAVKTLLSMLDIKKISFDYRERIKTERSEIVKTEILKRLNVIESFKRNIEQNKPEYMVMDVIPVIPPELRPLVPLEGGRFATSDLNDLYRRVIIRNNRLKKLLEIKAPEVIIRNEKRMIQEAVDSLFDNSRKNTVVRSDGKRPLKSLSDSLKGKQGRFRNNLLGKRVDYSGRSVIIVGPQLNLNQCGLPKEMALALYKPFLIRKLIEYDDNVSTIKNAKKEIEKGTDKVWELLEELVDGHPILLNRAPTLHRLGIQAFQPTLVEGKAIQLHPLVCKAFNADFDGDQMAVHLPLSPEAKLEARFLMLASQNLLHPATGRPIAFPTQDMVLGIYYMTKEKSGLPGEGKYFNSLEEILLAIDFNVLKYHSKIKYRYKDEWIDTTPGRVLFNDILPKELKEKQFYNQVMVSSNVEKVIEEVIEKVNFSESAQFLDRLKAFGFGYATKSGISIGLDDFVISAEKDKVLKKSEKEVEKLRSHYEEGIITDKERYNKVVDVWTKAVNSIETDMYENLKNDEEGFNPVYMMMDSKARGSKTQIKQICGIRGLMQKPQKSIDVSSGSVIENPIKTNFMDGLSVLDYFISTHGGRKGLADTALKTADAGYLTRKLVDVSQDVVVTEEDCNTIMGIEMGHLKEGDQIVDRIEDRIYGRVLADDVIDYKNNVDGEVIANAGDLITKDLAEKIASHDIESVKIRSVLTCEAKKGVCSKCYGINLATKKVVDIGEAVGIVAAQSIGEPGTQLTLRTFHVGGSADLTTTKSSVEAPYDGTVNLEYVETVEYGGRKVVVRRNGKVTITDSQGKEVLNDEIPYASLLHVKDKQKVKKGTTICNWDPFSSVILSHVDGTIVFRDIVEGSTYKEIVDDKIGRTIKEMIEPKERKLKPAILIVDDEGKEIAKYLPPTGGSLEIEDGDKVKAGQTLVKMQRASGKTKDITGGLPRVQELFEARNPKDPAIISEIDGKIKYGDFKGTQQQIIVEDINSDEKRTYLVPRGKHILVHEGDFIYAGERITDGSIKPHDILKILGTNKVQEFLVKQIQEVYRMSGVNPNDKHIEVIVRQMLQKVKIIFPGDTMFLEGDQVSKLNLAKANDDILGKVVVVDPGESDLEEGALLESYDVEKRNKELVEKGKKEVVVRDAELATFQPLLLGITQASLQVDSFISAASFQETTKVLTDAAIKSSVDYLEGLKENVIMGNLIPCGTGLARYNYINVESKGVDPYKIIEEAEEEKPVDKPEL